VLRALAVVALLTAATPLAAAPKSRPRSRKARLRRAKISPFDRALMTRVYDATHPEKIAPLVVLPAQLSSDGPERPILPPGIKW
jgi:hypothetical protein